MAESVSLSQVSLCGSTFGQEDGVQLLNRLDIVLRLLWQSKAPSTVLRHADKLRMRLRLPDTLLLRENGKERYKWMFTAKNGRLMKKLDASIGANPLAKACGQFCQQAAEWSKQCSGEDTAALLYREGEGCKECSIAELELLHLENVDSNVVALQRFVAPKSGICQSVLVCRYRFDKHPGKGICSVYRTNRERAYAALSGSRVGGIQLKASLLLKEIQSISQAIAKRLSNNFSTRVISMQLHFTIDAASVLWFLDAPAIIFEAPALLNAKPEGFAPVPTSGLYCSGDFCGYNSDEDEFVKQPPFFDDEVNDDDISEVDSAGKEEGSDTLEFPEEQSPRHFSVDHAKEQEFKALQKEMDRYHMQNSAPESPETSESQVSLDSQVPVQLQLDQPKKAQRLSRRKVKIAKQKIPRRLIKLAQKTDTRWMGENLRLWMKRKNSRRSTDRHIVVNLPVAKQLVFQDEFLEVDWEWTGNVQFINIELQQVELQSKTSVERFALASNLLNVGCCSVHLPVIDPDWASQPPKHWNIIISEATAEADTNDEHCVFACSEPFYVGGKAQESLDGVETVSREDASLKLSIGFSSNQDSVHHRTIQDDQKEERVCDKCYHVYNKLRTYQLVVPAPWKTASATQHVHLPGSGKPRRRVSLAKLESLSMPKRSYTDEANTEFVGNQQWGPGFNLRRGRKLRRHRSLPALPCTKSKELPQRKRKRYRRPSERVKERDDRIGTYPRTPRMEELVFRDENTYRVFFQVCTLRLDSLEAAQRFFDNHEPRTLAFAKVEKGKLVSSDQEVNTPLDPVFAKLLKAVSLIPELLLAVFDSEGCQAIQFDRAGPQQLKQIVEFMQIMAKADAALLPTFHIIRGIQASSLGDSSHAAKAWQEAIAESTSTDAARRTPRSLPTKSPRTSALWTYEAAVAHLFLGRTTERLDIKRKHLAAAQAIFTKLNYEKEKAFSSLLLNEVVSDDSSEERDGSLEWARHTIDATTRWLKDEGLLPQDGESPTALHRQRTEQIREELNELNARLKTGDLKGPELEAMVIRTMDRITKVNAQPIVEQSEVAHKTASDKLQPAAQSPKDDQKDLAELCFASCAKKDAAQLRTLLGAAPGRVDNMINANGESLLHVCAGLGWLEGLNVCLSKNANVDSRDVEGNTPLHVAASRQHTIIVNLLIALGADPTIHNIYGLNYTEGVRPLPKHE